MEKKAKKEGWNIRISMEAYKLLKAYCDENALFMSKFLDKIIIKEIKQNGK